MLDGAVLVDEREARGRAPLAWRYVDSSRANVATRLRCPSRPDSTVLMVALSGVS